MHIQLSRKYNSLSYFPGTFPFNNSLSSYNNANPIKIVNPIVINTFIITLCIRHVAAHTHTHTQLKLAIKIADSREHTGGQTFGQTVGQSAIA